MKKIVWLASYPKSGNTWFRAFLANLLRDSSEPVNINQIDTGGIASARIPFDDALGYDSSNLTHEEVDYLRREWYLLQASKEGPISFVKVHDAYTRLPNGQPIFPPEATYGVLYIVRNPLDVCVSYAHHGGKSDCLGTLKAMCRPRYSICERGSKFHEQLRQKFLSWSGHVTSWMGAEGHRIHVIRYEDMKSNPEATFANAAKFLEITDDLERIRRAIEFSRFEELKKQEEKSGFRERHHADRLFFRKGQVGSWRESLTSDQAQQLICSHRRVMIRLGYLDDNNNVVQC